QLLDVVFGDLLAVAIAQHRLEHDADRHRQALHVHPQRLAQGRQGIKLTGFVAELEILEGIERVVRHDGTPWVWDRVKLPFSGVLARLSLYVRHARFGPYVLYLI